ncbi:MAG: proline racemase family protein [Ktedonobacteraceae bacterium]|jgi:proline racemase
MQLNWNTRRYDEDAIIITTIDAHTEGEPLRIVTGGWPELVGATILERREYVRKHFDHLRRALMWEPRGHYNMYGCIVTQPVTPEADLGVLFMHNEGFSTMCGHGVIGLVTVLLETGALPVQGRQTPVNLDTPAGLVRATAHLDEHGHVERVSFLNVPSFLYAREVEIELSPFGRVMVDVAFGGAFYAILPAEHIGLQVSLEQTEQLIAAGKAIKAAVSARLAIQHPQAAELGFLYGTILTGPPENRAHHSRNITVFAHAEVDRSPTGTGVSARLALHAAKGELAVGQEIVIESILGAASIFSGRVVEHTRLGEFAAVVPEVSGKAYIVGRNEWVLDPHDRLGKGFLVS